MAQGDLGNLQVSVGVNTEQLNAGLKNAAAQVQSFTNTVNGLLGVFGVTLGLAGIAKIAEDTIKWGQELQTLSRQLNMTADQVARLQYAAAQSNVPIVALQSNFSILARNMNLAANGNAAAIKIFDDFGIAFRNSDGSLRNLNDVLPEIADRIHNTADKSYALAEAQVLLGRNARDTFGFLGQGAKAIKDLEDAMPGTSEQVNKFAKDSEDLSQEWEKLVAQFRIMIVEVLTPLIPKMEELIKAMEGADWKGISNNILSIADAFQKLYDAMKSVWDLALNNPASNFLSDALQGKAPTGIPKTSALTGENMQDIVNRSQPAATTQGTMPNIDLGKVNVGGGASGAGGGIKGQQKGYFDDLKLQMDQLKTKWGDVNKNMADITVKTMEQISTGIGSALADSIVDGKNFGDAFKQMWKDVAKQVIEHIVEMIVQLTLLFAWQVATGTEGQGGGPVGAIGKLFGFREGGAIGSMPGGHIPSARAGLVYADSGLAMTDSFGEGGIPAVLHPNEIVSPISQFFDMIKSAQDSGGVNVTVNGGNQDPRQLAEMIMFEIDRRKRRP